MGKKVVRREKRLRRRERRPFYSRGQVLSGSLARLGTTRASALDAGVTARSCSFAFSTANQGSGNIVKSGSLTSWATDEAVDVNSLALFGRPYQQHFNDSQR
jgi:hypothetical protein